MALNRSDLLLAESVRLLLAHLAGACLSPYGNLECVLVAGLTLPTRP
jgi:hypothetical protein